MKEKLEKIKDLLSSEYDGDILGKDIDAFAKDLYLSVFECEYDLSDIIPIINEYEEEAEIENTRWYYVFCGIIDMLDNGEKTAERLYDCFMHSLDILELFVKLYFENDDYISEEKLGKAKEKALGTFDKQILKALGIT